MSRAFDQPLDRRTASSSCRPSARRPPGARERARCRSTGRRTRWSAARAGSPAAARTKPRAARSQASARSARSVSAAERITTSAGVWPEIDHAVASGIAAWSRGEQVHGSARGGGEQGARHLLAIEVRADHHELGGTRSRSAAKADRSSCRSAAPRPARPAASACRSPPQSPWRGNTSCSRTTASSPRSSAARSIAPSRSTIVSNSSWLCSPAVRVIVVVVGVALVDGVFRRALQAEHDVERQLAVARGHDLDARARGALRASL